MTELLSTFTPFVVRYNLFQSDNTTHIQTSSKPGTPWMEWYHNTFTYTPGGSAGTNQIRIRTSGLVHNNTFTDIGAKSGEIEPIQSYSGIYYPPLTQIDELYIYDNTYNDCAGSGDSLSGAWIGMMKMNWLLKIASFSLGHRNRETEFFRIQHIYIPTSVKGSF